MNMAAQDVKVPNGPTDGISSINFSPTSNHFVATSWDKAIRCWEVQGNAVVPKVAFTDNVPILNSAWLPDGNSVVYGLCDGTVKLWDLASNQSRQIGQHAAGAKAINVLNDRGIVLSGSWDGTVKGWDTRQPQAGWNFDFKSKVYAMDALSGHFVVSTADKKNHVFTTTNMNSPYYSAESSLKLQTRCVALFSDVKGFAVGSIEGRVAIQYTAPADKDKSFAFKCHREGNNIYPVNSIRFHHKYADSFVTAGSDGTYHFWDKKNKSRLKQFNKKQTSISCTAFNNDTTLFAYSVSYDWHQGHEGIPKTTNENSIYIMSVKDMDIRPKK
eukprot:TRINITY_DN1640_c0_g1_i1.p1 TRINITY_DN1640_c0_g1~~TRINITY_DN1640_c0_g1_i1.p1  ORF type:complete len:328 (+),score=53.98 TRINITY_DN1640_c0_g1_i1:72-1055(+)